MKSQKNDTKCWEHECSQIPPCCLFTPTQKQELILWDKQKCFLFLTCNCEKSLYPRRIQITYTCAGRSLDPHSIDGILISGTVSYKWLQVGFLALYVIHVSLCSHLLCTNPSVPMRFTDDASLSELFCISERVGSNTSKAEKLAFTSKTLRILQVWWSTCETSSLFLPCRNCLQGYEESASVAL